jgi:hypothetical protein
MWYFETTGAQKNAATYRLMADGELKGRDRVEVDKRRFREAAVPRREGQNEC